MEGLPPRAERDTSKVRCFVCRTNWTPARQPICASCEKARHDKWKADQREYIKNLRAYREAGGKGAQGQIDLIIREVKLAETDDDRGLPLYAPGFSRSEFYAWMRQSGRMPTRRGRGRSVSADDE